PRPSHDRLGADLPLPIDLRHDITNMPTPVQMRCGRRAIDRCPGVGADDPVVCAAGGVGFKDELGHLMLVAGKVDTLMELQHELADFVVPFANFEPALASFL